MISYLSLLYFQNEKQHHVNIPVLKVLRRQIRSMRSSKYATVTIAYQSEMPVDVRWYRVSSRYNLPMSEIPNMLPIQGLLYLIKSTNVRNSKYASNSGFVAL